MDAARSAVVSARDMRPLSLVIPAFLFFVSSALAQSTDVRFDPPDPTSRTPVYAHIETGTSSCDLSSSTVTRAGNIISVTLHTDPTRCVNFPPLIGAPIRTTVDLGVLPAGVYDVVVGRDQLLAGVAEGMLVVRDAEPPFEVRPNALVQLSDTIRLTAPNLGIEPVTVRIGSRVAEQVSVSTNEIVIRPPADLGAGTYDVSITRTSGVTLRATAALHVAVPSAPSKESSAFYEKILFPVFLGGPGAFGAQWRTDISLHNGADFPWQPLQPSIFGVACFPICDTRPQARSDSFAQSASSATPAGIFEYAQRQAAEVADFNILVRDLSRSAQDHGTEIPVVRERLLFASVQPAECADRSALSRHAAHLRHQRTECRPAPDLSVGK